MFYHVEQENRGHPPSQIRIEISGVRARKKEGEHIIVDAGIGAPSDAALAMELGADACLINTAIALAGGLSDDQLGRRGPPATSAHASSKIRRPVAAWSCRRISGGAIRIGVPRKP